MVVTIMFFWNAIKISEHSASFSWTYLESGLWIHGDSFFTEIKLSEATILDVFQNVHPKILKDLMSILEN